jgi:hypothetical protein
MVACPSPRLCSFVRTCFPLRLHKIVTPGEPLICRHVPTIEILRTQSLDPVRTPALARGGTNVENARGIVPLLWHVGPGGCGPRMQWGWGSLGYVFPWARPCHGISRRKCGREGRARERREKIEWGDRSGGGGGQEGGRGSRGTRGNRREEEEVAGSVPRAPTWDSGPPVPAGELHCRLRSSIGARRAFQGVVCGILRRLGSRHIEAMGLPGAHLASGCCAGCIRFGGHRLHVRRAFLRRVAVACGRGWPIACFIHWRIRSIVVGCSASDRCGCGFWPRRFLLAGRNDKIFKTILGPCHVQCKLVLSSIF